MSASSRSVVREVNDYLARHVPITRAMGIRLSAFDDTGVTMTAPLKPNINDKGIAFGGTLAAILALSGWALTDLMLRREGVIADVLIASAATDYLAPVAGKIVARCPGPAPAALAEFLAAFRSRGRARLQLEARIEIPGGTAAVFRGTYVARAPADGSPALSRAALPARPRFSPRIPGPSGRSRSSPSAQR